MTSDGGKGKPKAPAGKDADRQERLAAALRENLRKRKLQERAREAEPDPKPADDVP